MLYAFEQKDTSKMKKVKTYEEELKETMEQLMELCKLGDEFVANHPPESFKVEPK